jgi:hypothetical protein
VSLSLVVARRGWLAFADAVISALVLAACLPSTERAQQAVTELESRGYLVFGQ